MFSTEKFEYAAQWTVVSLVVGSSSGTPHASHHFLRTADTPSQGLSVPASFALSASAIWEREIGKSMKIMSPVKHQSNISQTPSKHQSNVSQTPVKHTSNINQSSVKQSNTRQTPVNHQSSISQTSVKHQSHTSQVLVVFD